MRTANDIRTGDLPSRGDNRTGDLCHSSLYDYELGMTLRSELEEILTPTAESICGEWDGMQHEGADAVREHMPEELSAIEALIEKEVLRALGEVLRSWSISDQHTPMHEILEQQMKNHGWNPKTEESSQLTEEKDESG